MRVILSAGKWVNPRTLADVITLGNNRIWFIKSQAVAYEIDGVYKVRGMWPSGPHVQFLPSTDSRHRVEWTTFNTSLFLKFWKMYSVPVSVYDGEPIVLERFAGERANAFFIQIGILKIYFSQGIFMAYKWGDDSINVSENGRRNGTITKHINALVPTEHPRLSRADFLAKFQSEVPNFGAGLRMEWCN